LYGGQSNAEGDLQICFNGVWVFACDSWWISPNVNVAPIMYIRFSCSGNENSLKNCYNRPYNYYCNTVFGFICSNAVNCSNGTIRLTDGGGDNEGRVEICTDGIWMTIDARYWNYNNAKVVCRQLGYYDTWSVAITDTNWSGICDKEGSLRLSDGADSREGRIEICLNGYWGTVCSTGWDERDALVACTQAGHHTLRAIPVTNGYFGRGTGPVHMTRVDCIGNEESLTQCPYVNGIGATNCYHAKDVGVMCKESPIHYSVTIDTDTDAVFIGNR
uniref:SRCR domain-containing protein n=1 Tax=Amphimedon queenslandica TaxID=400682 RepID=A0A1X7SJW9_AMPQE